MERVRKPSRVPREGETGSEEGFSKAAPLSFVIREGLGAISVVIEQDHTTIRIFNIEDANIVITAINQARAAGAKRTTMWTGEVIADEIAESHIHRAETGTTWLGGTVTRLPDSPKGFPQFRIDWEELPPVH